MNPYPYVLNNPLRYVDPLGLAGHAPVMMSDGGGYSKSTPVPMVNTNQNVVNKVKEEVVKKETRGASSWSCKITSNGSTKTQPQSSFWSDIGNGLRQITMPVMDFVQGAGAGVLESISFGVSRDLEVYYDRDNEIIYLIGKVVGNTATGIVSGIGAAGSGAATVATSPTGVGAVAFGAATVYCGSVTVSAAGNAAANVMQIVSKASSGGGSKSKPNLEKVDDSYLKKKGIDAHELKKDIYGRKAKVAEYDIYVDKNTGELYTQRKPQYNKSGESPIATGENIKK